MFMFLIAEQRVIENETFLVHVALAKFGSRAFGLAADESLAIPQAAVQATRQQLETSQFGPLLSSTQ
jgi:hypothetical protein